MRKLSIYARCAALESEKVGAVYEYTSRIFSVEGQADGMKRQFFSVNLSVNSQ